VQVLEHEQHRARGGELGQRPEHRAEHLLAGHARRVGLRRWLTAVRQQPGQHRPGLDDLLNLGRRGTERVRERQVGHAVADLGTLAAQDGEATAPGDRHHLSDQPGLAHAGVAPDQRGHRVPGRGVTEQGAQPRHLSVPAYQRCHVPSPPPNRSSMTIGGARRQKPHGSSAAAGQACADGADQVAITAVMHKCSPAAS
jgi:hypothetical protein